MKLVAIFYVKIVLKLVKSVAKASIRICLPYQPTTYVTNVKGGNHVSDMVLFYDTSLLASVFFRGVLLWID